MHIALVPDDPRRRLVERLGAYNVYWDPLVHRPYGLFRIYRGERYVGAQLSRPCLSDCAWLDRETSRYAQSSHQEIRSYAAKASAWRRRARLAA